MSEPERQAEHCVECGKFIDTREDWEGGDTDGAELNDGTWVCSFECWEKVADRHPMTPSRPHPMKETTT
ncbi:MAG: hypothetical protein AAGI03_15565 [Pseudomonadota bacterium]